MRGRPSGSVPVALLLALALAGPAAAQSSNETQGDPSVNESDFDTTPPPEDDAYLDQTEAQYVNESGDAPTAEGEPPADDGATPPASEGATSASDDGASGDAGEPTLSESDFDMSAPTADESYLDDAEREYARVLQEETPPSSTGGARTPGPGAALVALAAVGAALLVRRW